MIDSPTWRSHLSLQLCKTLEETAFMLVEDPSAPLPEPTAAIEASLSFSGKQNGTAYIAVTESDARALATEMLGVDQEVLTTSDVCDNAVGELLNILTAWVLDSWWGEGIPHDLGLPKTQRLPLTQTKLWSLPDDGRIVVSTDSGATFISGLTLEE